MLCMENIIKDYKFWVGLSLGVSLGLQLSTIISQII